MAGARRYAGLWLAEEFSGGCLGKRGRESVKALDALGLRLEHGSDLSQVDGIDAQTCRALVLKGLVGAQTGLDGMVQGTGILVCCRLQQVLTVVNVRQMRRACLPVINGTVVGSSGIIVTKVMQASYVVGVFIVARVVCHLILSLFPNAIYK